MPCNNYEVSVAVPGRIEFVRPTAAFIVCLARDLHVPAAENTLFEVAIVEALTNALRHCTGEADCTLHCELEHEGRCLRFRVLNDAAKAPLAFAIPSGAIPWSDATVDAWETLPDSGYGLYLMRAVFPRITPVTREGRHGIEMELMF